MTKREWIAVFLGIFIIVIILIIFMLLCYGTAFYAFSRLISFLIIIALIFMVIKLYNNRQKNGMNILEKREIPENNEVIISALKKIKEEQTFEKVEDGVLLKNRCGTFLIKLVLGNGTLVGDISNKDWYLNKNKIENPFSYKADYYYLIYNPNIYYQVVGVKAVTLSELVFKIENQLLNKR